MTITAICLILAFFSGFLHMKHSFKVKVLNLAVLVTAVLMSLHNYRNYGMNGVYASLVTLVVVYIVASRAQKWVAKS